MQFKENLAKYKKDVDRALADFFRGKMAEVKPHGQDAEFFIRTLSEYTQAPGAKRIRAILALVAYELFRGKYPKALFDVAVAFELIHSFLLIHDDIIDRDDFRRSQPTAHNRFAKRYAKSHPGSGEHIGSSLAIMLGDTADAYAIRLVADSRFTAEQKVKIISLMYQNVQKTVLGELFDVLGCRTEKEIKWMNQYKTALYTFVNPLLVGASLAGAKPGQLKLIEAYGHELGIAFQIQDDILGLFGEEKMTGKPVGSDIREKRNTLLIHEAKKRFTPKQKSEFNTIWSKSKISKADIRSVQKLVSNSGALEYNQSIAQKLAAKAKTAINKLNNVNQQRQQFLIDLADFVVNRDK